MAGIYVHIPFCKQACHYCDFHFSTSMVRKPELVAALIREAELQREYLRGAEVTTLYLGGGTPSLLNEVELQTLLDALFRIFPVRADAEITLEANPDDLTPAKLSELKQTPINRLSIGLQSFHEPHLRLMNRAHSALESMRCVELAQGAGFSNISIDLIYGIPASDHSIWQADLAQAFTLGVQHISSYGLTIEPDTALGRWTKTGRFNPSTDDFTAEQFEILLAEMERNGFEQYEISNFCRPEFESRHNSNYWRGVSYIGLGPSAHSFNGISRQHNVANNAAYLKALADDRVPSTLDELSPEDQVNEYLLTSLRTKWGADLELLRTRYSVDLTEKKATQLAHLEKESLLFKQNDHLHLTNAGKLLADGIAARLFI